VRPNKRSTSGENGDQRDQRELARGGEAAVDVVDRDIRPRAGRAMRLRTSAEKRDLKAKLLCLLTPSWSDSMQFVADYMKAIDLIALAAMVALGVAFFYRTGIVLLSIPAVVIALWGRNRLFGWL
jgi:hypothetical protein